MMTNKKRKRFKKAGEMETFRHDDKSYRNLLLITEILGVKDAEAIRMAIDHYAKFLTSCGPNERISEIVRMYDEEEQQMKKKHDAEHREHEEYFKRQLEELTQNKELHMMTAANAEVDVLHACNTTVDPIEEKIIKNYLKETATRDNVDSTTIIYRAKAFMKKTGMDFPSCIQYFKRLTQELPEYDREIVMGKLNSITSY